MSLIRTLNLAIEKAEREREHAEQASARAQKAQLHAQGQLDQLEIYASETDLRWSTANAVHFSAGLMGHHQSFQQRLDQAIQLQRTAVQQAAQRVEHARQDRVQKEIRLRSLQKLRDQKMTEQNKRLAHREQKAMDELATQQFLRTMASANPMSGERT